MSPRSSRYRMYERHAWVRFLFAALIVLTTIVSFAARTCAATDDQFEMGSRHYAAQRWSLAAAEFRDYLDHHPMGSHAAEARFYLAECCVQLADHRQAEAELIAFLRDHPDHVLARQSIFRLGETLYVQQQYEAARERLNQYCAQSNDGDRKAKMPLALTYLAEIAQQRCEHREAVTLFDRALALQPADELLQRIRFGLAVSQLAIGNLNEAESRWNEVAQSRSRLAANSRLRLAALCVRQQRFEDALSHASKIPESRDDLLPHAAYWRGRALLGQSQFSEAAELWHATLERYPRHPLTHRLLFETGKAWKAAANPQRAEQTWNDLVNDWPQSEWADDALAEMILCQLADQRLLPAMTACKRLRAGYPNSPRLADVERRLVVQLLELGKYQLVSDSLARFADPDPSNPDTAYYRALAEIGLHNYQPALQRLEALTEGQLSGQRAEDVLVARMAALAGLGRFDEVLEKSAEYRSKYPDGRHLATCQSQAIRAALHLGGTANAAATLENFLHRSREHPDAGSLCWQTAVAQERAGDDAQALDTYLQLLALPANSYTLDGRLAAARVLEKLSRRDEAIEQLQKLASENHEYVHHDTVLYRLAWKLVDADRGTEADAIFQQLYVEHPHSHYWPEAVFRLAERATERQDYARAVRLLDELIACERNADVQSHALYLRGQIATFQKDWTETKRWMQQLIDRFPTSPLKRQAEYWLAESAYRLGDHEAAEQHFRDLATATRASNEAWMAMIPLRYAQELARREQWSEALEIAEDIPQRFPDFSQQYEVDYLRGRCLMGFARFQDARAAFEEALAGTPAANETAAMAQWMIGETYMHAKRYEDALRAYHRVELRYRFPRWQAAAALQIGKCHEAQGDKQEAAVAYTRAAEQYGDSSFADEARRRLQELESTKTEGSRTASR